MDNGAIEDLFASLGPINIRRMFGGKGIYHQGRILGVEVDGQILLKADGQTASEFAAAGAEQWSYEGKNGLVRMPYWTIPDEALDDPDRLAHWVELAWEAALRAKSAKK